MPETMVKLKPRERLASVGVKQLTTPELFSIILRTGTKTQPVERIVDNLLTQFATMYALRTASLAELQQVKGIGTIRAMELQAVIELGQRIQVDLQKKQGKITSSYGIAQEMIEAMRDLRQEHLLCLYLNTKNEILVKETIFIGSLNQSIAHPREIFRGAVRHSAARILLVHNHPSGNPQPSEQDYQFTTRVKACGELMGIELLDHLIIGEQEYVSLKEEGVV